MKIYTGTVWNKNQIQQCIDWNIGMVSSPKDPVQPNKIPNKISCIFDNGAYRAFKHNEPFDDDLFYKRLSEINRPLDFVVIPDIVRGGKESIKFSKKHIDRIHHTKYLVVQPDMEWDDISSIIDGCDGIFIGGLMPWNRVPYWVQHGHDVGLPVHMGRVATFRGWDKAALCGCDSTDGSTIIRHNRLTEVLRWRQHKNEQIRLIHV